MTNPYVGANGWPKPQTAAERRRLAKLDDDRNERPNEPPTGPRAASPDFGAGMVYGEMKRQRHAELQDMSDEIVLIDLSSIAFPIWHMSQAEPDPNRASQQIIARVQALASGKPHAAICCDSGKSFRHELAKSYKANRPESDAPLQHQITLARERLAADGFPIWSVRGFEADDVIATAVARALAVDLRVLIVSADKDLLQLVGPTVRAMSVRDGSILDRAAVFAKFGVYPDQMLDYLTLVGDASDNIKGAAGIGPKKAADLLAKYGTLARVYSELIQHGTEFKPALSTALKDFRPRLEETRALIALRADVPIPFDEIAAERVPREVAQFAMSVEEDEENMSEIPQPTAEGAGQQETVAPVDAAKGEAAGLPGKDATTTPVASSASRLNAETALAVRGEVLPAPPEWERGLDPRSMRDARLFADDMYASRMFGAYGTPQAVLSTVMLGRELGLPAMASLRSVHIIEGRHALAASLMVALVLKSGLAEYFEPVSFSDKEATYETKRKSGRNPIRVTHTIEMAQQAGLVKDKSGWLKNPTDMLVARACSRLARMVYPDLLAGLYTPDELKEIRDEQAA